MPLAKIMTGEKIRLGRLTTDDVPSILSWFDDEDFARHIDNRPPPSDNKKTITDFIEENEKSNTVYLFGLRTLDENTLVGFIALEGISWNQGVSWLVIGISPEQQGKGYGEEAMRLITRYGFEELNLHRIQLTVFEYNERGIALYEKIGFKREGTFREALHRNNQRYAVYMYGLLRHEYFAQKPRPQV